MWSPYSCFTVTFVGLLFTCLTDWYLHCPRCLLAGVIQGWIAYLSSSPCSPNSTPLLSGGEGEPWPDSRHHNEDLGEKERPNQLHWIPTAHGSWWCGRWVSERKKHWDIVLEMLFCHCEMQVCRWHSCSPMLSPVSWYIPLFYSAHFYKSSSFLESAFSSRVHDWPAWAGVPGPKWEGQSSETHSQQNPWWDQWQSTLPTDYQVSASTHIHTPYCFKTQACTGIRNKYSNLHITNKCQ